MPFTKDVGFVLFTLLLILLLISGCRQEPAIEKKEQDGSVEFEPVTPPSPRITQPRTWTFSKDGEMHAVSAQGVWSFRRAEELMRHFSVSRMIRPLSCDYRTNGNIACP